MDDTFERMDDELKPMPNQSREQMKALRTGRFHFEQTDVSGDTGGDFVFVPKYYNFDEEDSLEKIFKALKTEFPKFVFNFGNNNCLSPYPKNKSNQSSHLWVENILSTIPSEGVMFLIARPYGGNLLSQIAVEVADRKKIRSLALLSCEGYHYETNLSRSSRRTTRVNRGKGKMRPFTRNVLGP